MLFGTGTDHGSSALGQRYRLHSESTRRQNAYGEEWKLAMPVGCGGLSSRCPPNNCLGAQYDEFGVYIRQSGLQGHRCFILRTVFAVTSVQRTGMSDAGSPWVGAIQQPSGPETNHTPSHRTAEWPVWMVCCFRSWRLDQRALSSSARSIVELVSLQSRERG